MATWDEWLKNNEDTLNQDSGWEWRFATEVLRKVSSLEPDHVTCQFPFKDLNGKRRRLDFAIQFDKTKLAIEIDGFDKTGSGTGMTKQQFEDFLLRQNSLASDDWKVYRFSNAFQRDHPTECVRIIEHELEGSHFDAEESRKLLELYDDQIEALRRRVAEFELRREEDAQRRRVVAIREDPARKGELDAAEQRLRQLSHELDRARALSEDKDRAIETLTKELERKNEQHSRENRFVMRLLAVTLMVVVVAFAAYVIMGRDSPPPPEPTTPPPIPARSISWQQAGSYVSESIKVCDLVSEVRSSSSGWYMNFLGQYPDNKAFVRFASAPVYALGERVCCTGTIIRAGERLTMENPQCNRK